MKTELNESDARAIVEHAENLSGGGGYESSQCHNVAKSPPSQSSRYRFDDVNHIHLLDDRPLMGTSTVVNVLAKEGLTWWSAELAAVTCMEDANCDGKGWLLYPHIRQEYEAMSLLSGKDKKNARDKLQRKYPIFKRARYAHKEKKESTAGPGTEMHEFIETYVSYCIHHHKGVPQVPAINISSVCIFADWAIDHVDELLWSEGHCYSETLWTGGICDCGAILEDGTLAFIDFKSAKDAYYGHFVQCAGYARQISENGVLTPEGQRLCAPVELGGAVLMVFPFGVPDPRPVVWRNAQRRALLFEAAVTLYNGQREFEELT